MMKKPGLIFLIPVFLSCETAEDLGIEYQLGDGVGVRFEEFILPTTNIIIDSLRTDSENRILTGRWEDPITGHVRAEGYASFVYAGNNLPGDSLREEYLLDSAFLYLQPRFFTANSINDSIIVRQVQNRVEDVVYLSSTEPSKTRHVASGFFSGSITDSTVFSLSLKQSFSEQLLSSMEGLSENDLPDNDLLPSIAISGPESLLFSFQLTEDTIAAYLYLRDIGGANTIKEIIGNDTIFNDTTYLAKFSLLGNHYTFLDRDRSATEFANIGPNQSFSLSEGKTYVDPLSGVSTIIDLSPLEAFFMSNPNILISSASLDIEFENEGRRDTLENFNLFFRKENGGINSYTSIRNQNFVFVYNAFENIVLTDNSYFGSENALATSFLSSDKDRLILVSTLFHQRLSQGFQENDFLSVFDEPVNELVSFSVNDVTLARTIIKKDGIKLRVFFTEVN